MTISYRGTFAGMAAIMVSLAPVKAFPQICTGEDTNTNQAYVVGDIRVKEHIEFVYSSYNEPPLVTIEEGRGNHLVFQAIKRAMNTVETAIRDPKNGGVHKEHNLFSLKKTDLPFHPSQVSDTGFLNHGAYVDNNYFSQLYSGDGINSIGWVDFTLNADLPGAREGIGALTYTIWNHAGQIIERDIILQTNEFNSWAILADLTKGPAQETDCTGVLDIQGVITHMLAQAVGLRPVTDDGDPTNGYEFDSSMSDPWGFLGLSGRVVLSNFGFPTQQWQTLTPGDIEGLVEAAPDKGDEFAEPLAQVVEEPSQVVLHYDFEDISIGTARDQSGNGLDGDIVGAAVQIAGVHGQAVDLSNGEHIDLDGANFPREKIPQNAFTIAAWIDLLGSGQPQRTVFEAADQFGYLTNGHIFLSSGSAGIANGTVDPSSSLVPIGTVTEPTEPRVHFFFAPLIFPDGWFHYAVTYDRSAGESKVYVNGTLVSTAPLSNDAPLSSSWSGGAFIGQNAYGLGFYTNPLNALMDEFYLLNYALEEDRINDLMNDISP